MNEKLEIYHELLLKWQEKINLISPNSIDEARERHFEDSLQLLGYLPARPIHIVDIGSGAGFPGICLALSRDDIQLTLIESDQKKCAFMRTVSRETSVNFKIFNKRIETVDCEELPSIDFITSRALCDLKKMFDFVRPWMKNNLDLRLLLLKGENVESEIIEAEKFYNFQYDKYPSKTSAGGVILDIRTVQKCA